jgi:uncharacterized membrane protein YidH (DUF202 family)
MDNPVFSTERTVDRQIPLPNSNAVLVLGIISVILCWCHGIIGLIIAIIALVLASKDTALYNANPGIYTQSSYKNLKTGRTTAIIGLVLAGVFMFLLLIALFILGLNFAFFPWELLERF